MVDNVIKTKFGDLTPQDITNLGVNICYLNILELQAIADSSEHKDAIDPASKSALNSTQKLALMNYADFQTLSGDEFKDIAAYDEKDIAKQGLKGLKSTDYLTDIHISLVDDGMFASIQPTALECNSGGQFVKLLTKERIPKFFKPRLMAFHGGHLMTPEQFDWFSISQLQNLSLKYLEQNQTLVARLKPLQQLALISPISDKAQEIRKWSKNKIQSMTVEEIQALRSLMSLGQQVVEKFSDLQLQSLTFDQFNREPRSIDLIPREKIPQINHMIIDDLNSFVVGCLSHPGLSNLNDLQITNLRIEHLWELVRINKIAFFREDSVKEKLSYAQNIACYSNEKIRSLTLDDLQKMSNSERSAIRDLGYLKKEVVEGLTKTELQDFIPGQFSDNTNPQYFIKYLKDNICHLNLSSSLDFGFKAVSALGESNLRIDVGNADANADAEAAFSKGSESSAKYKEYLQLRVDGIGPKVIASKKNSPLEINIGNISPQELAQYFTNSFLKKSTEKYGLELFSLEQIRNFTINEHTVVSYRPVALDKHEVFNSALNLKLELDRFIVFNLRATFQLKEIAKSLENQGLKIKDCALLIQKGNRHKNKMLLLNVPAFVVALGLISGAIMGEKFLRTLSIHTQLKKSLIAAIKVIHIFAILIMILAIFMLQSAYEENSIRQQRLDQLLNDYKGWDERLKIVKEKLAITKNNIELKSLPVTTLPKVETPPKLIAVQSSIKKNKLKTKTISEPLTAQPRVDKTLDNNKIIDGTVIEGGDKAVSLNNTLTELIPEETIIFFDAKSNSAEKLESANLDS